MKKDPMSQHCKAPLRIAVLAASALMAPSAWAGTPIGGTVGYGPLAIAVPTLGEWSLVLLALLLAAVAYRVLRGRVGGRLLSQLFLAGGVAAAGLAGHGLVRQAEAVAFPELDNATGGSVTVYGWATLDNVTSVPLRINAVTPNSGSRVKSPPAAGTPECAVGTVVQPADSCNVEFEPKIPLG